MISIIVAIAQNGVIGGENTLLWHISEDLKRFKAITSGHPVVMGRKTYESLGRPLPNRLNVVISHQTELTIEGCTVVGSLEQAMGLFDVQKEEIFIIGGGQIYAQAMEITDRLYVTYVDHDYQGDTLFPKYDMSLWKLTLDEYHEHGEKFPYPFSYLQYERVK